MRPALVIAFALTVAARSPAADPPDKAATARDAVALVQRACVECHGPDKQKGVLRLDTRAAALAGGDTGPAVVPGKPDKGELLRRAALPAGAEGAMPPRGDRLSAKQLQLLRDWIDQGADWPAAGGKHWAYVAPKRPPAPVSREPQASGFVRNAIDAFVLARLTKEGLKPAPEAPREVLIRRLSLDLIGLPPTPAEIDAFVKDGAPDAYEKVIDRLLASPQFGVKWARPWLDAARYADSHGFQRDDLRDLWAYRDWVVNALNADMPFDRFTIEQLAGDLLPNATTQQKVATGFNRSAPTNVEAGSDPEDTRVNQVFDRVNTLGTVWLGSTLECAQCHDHKYDPFAQKDYYKLFAFFNSTALEADRANPKVPGSIKFLGPVMELTDPGARTKTPPVKTLVMQELLAPRPTTVFKRGDFRAPGERVEPGTPTALHAFDPKAERNRLGLAQWLVSKDNPLTARVTVNRLWSELFGQGLVTTPEDFGVKGEPPTHPKLLDWLACEFVELSAKQQGADAPRSPWSVKHLLRTVVLSSTYRQSSRVTPDLRATDPENRFLARGPRFRLDAEAIRDNALSIAGLLSPKLGGPPVRPPQPDGLWVKVGGEKYNYVVSTGEDKYRRGLYVVWKRGAPYPGFVAFDGPARIACRVARPRTNTPLQALTLLNDPVYVEAALNFAKRVVTEKPDASTEERIAFAFRLAVARAPRPNEVAVLKALFDAERDAMTRDPAAAKRLAKDITAPATVTPAEFAAWYAVCTALLNLDETITKG